MLYGYLLLAALGSVGLAAALDSGDGGGSDGGDVGGSDDGGDDGFFGDDTGATAEVDEDGTITIDVGDDETGSLVAVKTIGISDYNVPEPYGLDFYLLPKGVTFPIDPDGSTFQTPGEDWETLGDLMASLGAEKVTSVDLGTYTVFSDKPVYGDDEPEATGYEDDRVEPPTIEVNADYSIVVAKGFVATKDGEVGNLVSTIPAKTLSPFEPQPEYFHDALKVEVNSDTTGTSSDDWFFVDNTTSEQVVVRGLGGADFLESDSDHVALFGGPESDQIRINGTASIAKGGDGNDGIYVTDVDNIAEGGAGDDSISIGHYTGGGTTGTVVHGGSGNDSINATLYGDPATHVGIEIYGDDGNDTIWSQTGDKIYGGAGDDWFDVAHGVRAYGGTGDDEFYMEYDLSKDYNFVKEMGPSVIEMGAGADRVNIVLKHAEFDEGQTSDPIRVLHITDFDTAEDKLNVTGAVGFSAINVDSIDVAKDQSYTTVTVRAQSTFDDKPQPDLLFQVRLDGVTDFTKEMFSSSFLIR